jgi:hypothetical protein
MAKDTTKRVKDRDEPQAAKGPGERGTAGGQNAAGQAGAAAQDTAPAEHHASQAHGRPTQVDTTLPATRAELMDLHREARARRNSAGLGSEAFRAAVMDLERIEVRIAAVDRDADPPLG